MLSEEPLVLVPDDALPADYLEAWLWENFPERCLGPPGSMASQIAKHLQLVEGVLHEHAHAELLGVDPMLCKISEKWLMDLGVEKHVYATDLLLNGSPMDGLFLVLVASFLEFVITITYCQGL